MEINTDGSLLVFLLVISHANNILYFLSTKSHSYPSIPPSPYITFTVYSCMCVCINICIHTVISTYIESYAQE